MKTLLIVEDDFRFARGLKTFLEEAGFVVILAHNIDLALKTYGENKESISALVLDGYLTKKTINVTEWDTTIPLIVKAVEDRFTGPIVAMSTSPRMRERMVKAGCTHQCEKGEAVVFVPSLLSV